MVMRPRLIQWFTRGARACVHIAVCMFAILGDTPQAVAQASVRIDKADHRQILNSVLAQWKARREQAHSVRYVAAGTMRVPKGTLDGDALLPAGAKGAAVPEDHVYDYNASWLIDFRHNRFRIDLAEQAFNITQAAFHPQHELYVFDGTELRCHEIGVSAHRGIYFGPTQPEFRYHQPDWPVLTMKSVPAFVAHGIILPAANMKAIGNVGSSLPVSHFLVHGTGMIKDREYVVLRTIPTPSAVVFELWVDRSRSGAVARVRRFEGEYLEAATDIEYRETAYGWYPQGWTFIRYGFDKKVPTDILKLTVTEFELNPPLEDSHFRLEPQAGMVIRDDHSKTAYVLGPHGEHLSIEDTILRAGQRRASYLLWLGILFAGATAILAALYWRRLRRCE